MKIVAVCHTCARRHLIDFDPRSGPGAAFGDWLEKHPGGLHATDFLWPERSGKKRQAPDGWLHYLHNADVKTAYASSAAYTIGLASLATSATLVAGREGTAVSNTTNLYLDYLIGGKVTVGTTPTAATVIEIWAYGSVDDTPTYPDVLDGTDSAETFDSPAIKANSMGLLDSLEVDETETDNAYWLRPTSLAKALTGGDFVPKNHGLFVTHNTVAALNSTAGNHVLSHTGVYLTVA